MVELETRGAMGEKNQVAADVGLNRLWSSICPYVLDDDDGGQPVRGSTRCALALPLE